MSETRWTPGPWEADGNEICDAKGELLACAYRMDADDGYAVAEHTARLISAVPDLYEALEEVLDLIDREHGSLYSDVQRKGRAALAKAEAK